MRQKNTRVEQIESNKNPVIIEKKTHRSNLKRLLHILYLFFPVGSAFLGAIFSEKILTVLTKIGLYCGVFTETFKFCVATVLFLTASVIVFILTRPEKTVIEIKISDSRKE